MFLYLPKTGDTEPNYTKIGAPSADVTEETVDGLLKTSIRVEAYSFVYENGVRVKFDGEYSITSI